MTQFTPPDILNRAFDRLPEVPTIDTMLDGSPASEWGRRNYGRILRALLRTAHWSFARKMAKLQLLADATGQTLDPVTNNPISTKTEIPWTYAYAWPTDGVNARWMPWTPTGNTGVPPGNIAASLTTGVVGQSVAPTSPLQIPARFLVGQSDQFPVQQGVVDFTLLPDLEDIEGVGPTGRKIVWSDVPDGHFCYTKLVLEIELWDDLFSQAMVSSLAEAGAIRLIKDPKLAMTIRSQEMAIARDAISQARVMDANDQGFPQTTNHQPSWITARSRGGWWGGMGGMGGWDEGPGILFNPWSPMAFSDGSVF